MKKILQACGLCASLSACVTAEDPSYRIGSNAPIKSAPVVTSVAAPAKAAPQPQKTRLTAPQPAKAAPATGGRAKLDTTVRAGTEAGASRAPVQIKLYD